MARMAPSNALRKLPPACAGLAIWLVSCVGWVLLARPPWQTRALDLSVGFKQTPRDDFVAAGLWIGLLVSGGMAVVLLLTHRWWGGAGAAPVDRPVPEAPLPIRRRRFVLILAALGALVLWLCLPALPLSFWGDEAMMFSECVHGEWRPARPGGSFQDGIRFREASWAQAFFSDQYGANHWLATHLQRLVLKGWQLVAHRPAWDFEEWVVRLVPLGAGVVLLAAQALWIRSLGRPLAGLVAAGFLALHPSFIRFSVEARGYSLMLLFFVLTLWSISRALRFGRKRDWLLVGIGQFLMLYSWKGAVYPLVFINLVTGVRLFFGPVGSPAVRRTAVARWFAAGLVGAMVFIPLTTSSQLQIRKSIEVTRKRAKPMDAVWRDNLVSETLLGIPWHEGDPESPREVSIERLRRQTGLTLPMVAMVGGLLLIGLARLWVEDRFLAWLVVAVAASGVAAALHFKFLLRVELLTWYLVYHLPLVALLFGVAVTPAVPAGCRVPLMPPGGWPRGVRVAGAAAALVPFSFLAVPKVADFRRHPRENYKQATLLTRGRHEPAGFAGPSRIHTGWLWRHASLYDPRGDTKVRTMEALEERCRRAQDEGGEFYMVVGMRHLSEAVFPGLMRRLRDPGQFDHLATLWGGEPLNTLEVYRWRRTDRTASGAIGAAADAPATVPVSAAKKGGTPGPAKSPAPPIDQ